MRRQTRFLLLVLCLVVLCEAAGSQQPSPTVNLRQRQVACEPGMPKVRVTVDRPRVPLGTRVTFTLSPASVLSDHVVTLDFGDGTEPTEFTGPQVTHPYDRVGTYTYAVCVKPRQKARQRCDARVTLSATPSSVPEGEPVKFSAQLSESCPNIQYRFVFDDGSSSDLQSRPDAQHRYAKAGQYLAYVDISDNNGHIGGSLRIRIDVTRQSTNVTRPPDVSVSLTAEPLSARTRKPVTFTAKASPARADARYLFNFGDRSQTSWQTDPQSNHTYRTRGVYRAYVQVSQFVGSQSVTATSAPVVLSVQRDTTPDPGPGSTPTTTPDTSPTPTSPTTNDSPPPSPGNGSPSPGAGSSSPGSSPSGSNGTNVTGSDTPSPSASNSPGLLDDTSPGRTWLYLLIAAVILFLIYQASGFLFAAQPTFRPFADHGVAAVAHEKGALPIDFELVLDPNVSGGDYSVTTDQPRLLTNAPEPEDRQVIEI